MLIKMSDSYELRIDPAGGAELLRGGVKVRSVAAGPGEKPGTIFARLLEDKTLVGADRLAVLKIVQDSALLKNGTGFIAW